MKSCTWLKEEHIFSSIFVTHNKIELFIVMEFIPVAVLILSDKWRGTAHRDQYIIFKVADQFK